MSNETDKTMHALVLQQYNEPYKLTEVKRPQATAGHVLIKIAASGINPLDLKIKAGKAPHAKTNLPAILGLDLAGIVEALGDGVTDFKIGDEVYGITGGVGNIQGSLAQYAAVDADLLALKPKGLNMRETAALPLIFTAAWEALVDKANVSAGATILIHGGAGGVGHIAVQLAVAIGAKVFATAKPKDKNLIENYGATHIDYTSQTIEDYTKTYTAGEGFDVILDTVGGDTLGSSFAVAKQNTGHVVSILGRGMYDITNLSLRGVSYSGVITLLPLLLGKGRKHHGDIMKEATKLVEAGRLKPIVDRTKYTLQTIEDAYKAYENKTATGKLVVEI